MKVNVQTDGIIITSKQEATIEKKIKRLKKYLSEEQAVIDVMISDETGPEKGGIDQTVQIKTTIGKEKIIIEESDDRIMRAFAYAFERFERQLSRYHQRKVESAIGGGKNRVRKFFPIFGRENRK